VNPVIASSEPEIKPVLSGTKDGNLIVQKTEIASEVNMEEHSQ